MTTTSASDSGRWPPVHPFDREKLGQTAQNRRPQLPKQPKLWGEIAGEDEKPLDRDRMECGRSRDRPFARKANGQPAHFLHPQVIESNGQHGTRDLRRDRSAFYTWLRTCPALSQF